VAEGGRSARDGPRGPPQSRPGPERSAILLESARQLGGSLDLGGTATGRELRRKRDFWPAGEIFLQGPLTGDEESLELASRVGALRQRCPRPSGLLFDNLVVTTSIPVFRPVQDWKKTGVPGS
jgi:hypothetical protein